MTHICYFNVYEAFNDIEVQNISLEAFVFNQKEASMNSAKNNDSCNQTIMLALPLG